MGDESPVLAEPLLQQTSSRTVRYSWSILTSLSLLIALGTAVLLRQVLLPDVWQHFAVQEHIINMASHVQSLHQATSFKRLQLLPTTSHLLQPYRTLNARASTSAFRPSNFDGFKLLPTTSRRVQTVKALIHGARDQSTFYARELDFNNMDGPPYYLIEENEEHAGRLLCDILVNNYKIAYAAGRRFTFAISGGSMLEMLSHLENWRLYDENSIDWSKCTMAFATHRCVPLDDEDSTYCKARPKFLDRWMELGLKVITPMGSTDAEKEATAYEAALKDAVPFDAEGYPVFDLTLLEMGADGHIGAIYPNTPEVESPRVVVPVIREDGMGNVSPELSLSIAAMRASNLSVVMCTGTSTVAPHPKAIAMERWEIGNETTMSFPANALRMTGLWITDADAGHFTSRSRLLESMMKEQLPEWAQYSWGNSTAQEEVLNKLYVDGAREWIERAYPEPKLGESTEEIIKRESKNYTEPPNIEESWEEKMERQARRYRMKLRFGEDWEEDWLHPMAKQMIENSQKRG